MKAANTIWLVRSNSGSSDIHYRKETAIDEAEKIARLRPGEPIYLMEAIEAYVVSTTVPEARGFIPLIEVKS